MTITTWRSLLLACALLLCTVCLALPRVQVTTERAEGGVKGKRAHQDLSLFTHSENCMACHNADPSKSGTVGPAVKGSSRALIEARVLRTQYPPGYTPKRETKLMIPMPQLSDRIDDLSEYLR